jgi:hypothetical protein
MADFLGADVGGGRRQTIFFRRLPSEQLRVFVGGEATRDLSDESEAIAQLKELGRQKWPTASELQQFERALLDPKNAELTARAHRRPQATAANSFPFPR